MKNRARLSLHAYLFQNALALEYEGRPYPMGKGNRFSLTETPQEGDLVALMHTGTSPWSLSWVVGGRDVEGVEGHLLESVETGEPCDWTNVQLVVFDRETVADNPHWRWTDEQFAFDDLWRDSLRASGAGLSFRAAPVRFDPDGGCTLKVTRRVAGDVHERSFPDWHALAPEAMRAFCRDADAAPLDVPERKPAA